MITIDCPTIEKKGKEVYLQAIIKDDLLKLRFPLWYSVEECYGPYLCEDRGDAFLLVSLMYAMKSHQDVLVKAPVSKRFLYNIDYVIQPLLSKLIPESSCVKIEVLDGECPELKGKAVGCGCSLGVDSLSSLYRHMGNHVIEEYRVSHLALFNSCQLGYLNKDLDESSFREAVKGLSSFSEEVGLPIVAVNTNLNDFFIEAGFKTAKSRFVLSTISCPLALQKLFGKYIYASSTPLQSFELSQTDQSFAEAAYVPLLSTESTEIILADASLTRVEKTAYISKNPLTPKYLDVCWATQAASSISHIDKWLKGKTKKNCGWCDKCLRTLFTLELLGEDLQKYNGIFDLSKYYAHRNGFIKTVILNKHKDHLYQEIFSLMSEKHYKVPRRVKYSVMKAKVYRILRGIRSRLRFPKSL